MLAQIGSLNEKETQAIAEFEARLHDTLPGRVRSLILFGSKARGDAHPDSDIDLLVVVDEFDQQAHDAIAAAEWDVFEKTGACLEPHVYSYKEIQRRSALGAPFMVNVAHDGVVLEGEAIVVSATNKREVSQGLLGAARERLQSAKLLLDHGLYRDSISRSYYAFLHAADSALVVRGFTPKSHSATVSLFGQHIVQTGLLAKQYGRWINKAVEARMDADYEYDLPFSFATAKGWLDKATEFVDVIESVVQDWLARDEGGG